MPIKLNKSEQAIMDQFNGHRMVSISRGGGTGPMGGKVNYGTRNVKIAFGLLKKGLIKLESSALERETRRGRTVYHNDYCFVKSD